MTNDKLVRYFCLVAFIFEEDLIEALNTIQKKIGYYDYFSANIKTKFPENLMNRYHGHLAKKSEGSIKLISFPKLRSVHQFQKYYTKLKSIERQMTEKQNRSLFFLPGYLNTRQVVIARSEADEYAIASGNHFLSVQYVWQKSGFVNTAATDSLLLHSATMVFYGDLRRLYLENMGRLQG